MTFSIQNTHIKKQFDFEPFNKRFQKYYPNKPLPDKHFLEWFIGFFEATGSFSINYKKSAALNLILFIQININEKDKHTLDFIATKLGLGTVTKYGKTQYKFKVRPLEQLSVLIELFNGNCVVFKHYKKFENFLETYNAKVKSTKYSTIRNLGIIGLKRFTVDPSLEDAWLSGFTDGAGSFYEDITKIRNQSKKTGFQKFKVSLSDLESLPVLENLKIMLKCGQVYSDGEYSFTVSDIMDSVDKIAPYFKRFLLKTVKRVDFDRWFIVVTALKAYYELPNAEINIDKIIESELEKLQLYYKSDTELSIYYDFICKYLDNIEYYTNNQIEKSRFNFEPFNKRFKKYYPNKPLPDQHFLEWFVGFVEGDGTLYINKNKKKGPGSDNLVLGIHIHKRDKHVLDQIQKIFDFGNTGRGTDTLCYYVIQDLQNICIIIELFNGNCVMPKFYRRFVDFIIKYNEKVKNSRAQPKTKKLGTISLKPFTVKPSAKTAWLSGFTDSDGCFHESITKTLLNKKINRYQYFKICQKGWDSRFVLIHFKQVLNGGSIEIADKNVDYYCLRIIDVIKCVDIIIPYFREYPLKTLKLIDFERWALVLTVLKAHHRRQNRDPIIAKEIKIELEKLEEYYKSRPELSHFYDYLRAHLTKINYYSNNVIKKES